MGRNILDFDDAGAADDHPARGITVGDIRRWHDESIAASAAVTAERQRCADIVQLAREGEIDGDFRSIINRIKNP